MSLVLFFAMLLESTFLTAAVYSFVVSILIFIGFIFQIYIVHKKLGLKPLFDNKMSFEINTNIDVLKKCIESADERYFVKLKNLENQYLRKEEISWVKNSLDRTASNTIVKLIRKSDDVTLILLKFEGKIQAMDYNGSLYKIKNEIELLV